MMYCEKCGAEQTTTVCYKCSSFTTRVSLADAISAEDSKPELESPFVADTDAQMGVMEMAKVFDKMATLEIDPVSNDTINRWFDYWLVQDAKQHRGSAETIKRIRALAIAGAGKARRNKKAVDAAVVAELRSLATLIETAEE